MAGLETHILTFIRHFLTTVGYPGIFVLMAVEGFGIPIPSELTMPFSGFLASSGPGAGKFVLPAVIAVGTVGEVVGGIIAYAVGYYGGRPALERYGHLVLLSTDELERGETWFSRYGDWIVLVTRLLPAIRSFIALPAGVVRMPFWRFLLYGTLGSLVWCTVLALIGHALGQNWQNVSTGLRKYDVILVVILVAIIIFAIYKRITAGRKPASREPAPSVD